MALGTRCLYKNPAQTVVVRADKESRPIVGSKSLLDPMNPVSHLCTSDAARGLGVARAMVTELKKLTKAKGLRGIGLNCRADYEASGFWPKVGFCPIDEREGKSKDGKTLTYWWYNHGLPDLFALSAGAGSSTRIVATIDANIFFDLITDREQGEESRALIADWLQSEIELCITDEIYHEINRGEDEEEKRRCRERVSLCRMLHSPEEGQVVAREEIVRLLGEGTSAREKSDRAQLIKAAAAKAQVFLTRDDKLVKASDEIQKRLGLEVMEPADLIGRIDELRRIAAYEPARLAGSHITMRLIKAEEVDSLPVQLCHTGQGEKYSDFRQKIRALTAYPERSQVFAVHYEGADTALVAFERSQHGDISVPYLRVLSGPLAQTVSRHLALRAIQAATDSKAGWVRITDCRPTEELITALAELSFFQVGGNFVRCVLRTTGPLNDVLVRLRELNGATAEESAKIASEIERLQGDPGLAAAELERVFWPVKVLNGSIPTFGIAIHPKWAQHFFDEGIAEQELFGADPLLALNREHVYFRSPNLCGLRDPARIVWYVTKDGNYQGSMALRACSRLLSVEVGKPKDLFRRYQRLGVYRWENLFELADHNKDNDIMALRFADTELFKTPISLAEAKRLGIKANFESPVQIAEPIFHKIYQQGLGAS